MYSFTPGSLRTRGEGGCFPHLEDKKTEAESPALLSKHTKVPKPQSQDKEGQRPRPVSRLNCVTRQELPTDSFPPSF